MLTWRGGYTVGDDGEGGWGSSVAHPVGAFLGERVVVVKDVVADVDDSLLERRQGVGPVVPRGARRESRLNHPGRTSARAEGAAASATNTAIAARVRKRGGTRITNDSSKCSRAVECAARPSSTR